MTALIGYSVNFTWNFSGDVDTVVWGLKHPTLNYIDSKKRLVYLGKLAPVSVAVHPAYNGRVSGSRSGDASSGLATFTLSNINSNDEAIYGCSIFPDGPYDLIFDPVHLVVEGEP